MATKPRLPSPGVARGGKPNREESLEKPGSLPGTLQGSGPRLAEASPGAPARSDCCRPAASSGCCEESMNRHAFIDQSEAGAPGPAPLACLIGVNGVCIAPPLCTINPCRGGGGSVPRSRPATGEGCHFEKWRHTRAAMLYNLLVRCWCPSADAPPLLGGHGLCLTPILTPGCSQTLR